MKNKEKSLIKAVILGTALLISTMPALAVDHAIDIAKVERIAKLQPLMASCRNLGKLESRRDALIGHPNPEQLRAALQQVGPLTFYGCSKPISITGVKPLGR